MKNIIKNIILILLSVLYKFIFSGGRVSRFLQNEIAIRLMSIYRVVHHNGCKLKFNTPNILNHFRVDSFSTKEPETLEWIDSMPKGSTLWDVGANVGLYSCYAAKQKNCTVFSFEPSVFNLELLARNIFINDLVEKITIVPLPLSDNLAISLLNMSTTDWGGALSTFGQSYGHDGKNLEKKFEFRTIGLSMLDAVQKLKIPSPNYIKIDVDGIEHLILKGGGEVLLSASGVLVEVNNDYKKQAKDVDQYLVKAGFILKEKRHSEIFENDNVFGNSYNQIWERKI